MKMRFTGLDDERQLAFKTNWIYFFELQMYMFY